MRILTELFSRVFETRPLRRQSDSLASRGHPYDACDVRILCDDYGVHGPAFDRDRTAPRAAVKSNPAYAAIAFGRPIPIALMPDSVRFPESTKNDWNELFGFAGAAAFR